VIHDRRRKVRTVNVAAISQTGTLQNLPRNPKKSAPLKVSRSETDPIIIMIKTASHLKG
jgi:hypothetical protein